MPLDTFTFTRLSDGRVSEFSVHGTIYGCLSYRMEGCPFRIHWHPRWGWCATDEAENVVGLPLDTPKPDQRNRPPAGTWVRRNGAESHVYTLRWGRAEADARAEAHSPLEAASEEA